jgi:hypothetical protein
MNDLSMLIGQGQEAIYYVMRRGITGGLSNVHNRLNIKGLITIKSPLYTPEDDTVSIIEGGIITHNICLDANSLYLTSFSSTYLPWSSYTNGIMYMAGAIQRKIEDKALAMKIIDGREELFVCVIKGGIPKEYYNTPIWGAASIFANVLKFPLIIRNIDIRTSPEVIGQTMYDFMKENKIPIDKKERKLTQLLNTNGEYMMFSTYYLWFLIDVYHFVVEDVEILCTFSKNKQFNEFATEMMKKRIENPETGESRKLIMNSTLGSLIKNQEKYTH